VKLLLYNYRAIKMFGGHTMAEVLKKQKHNQISILCLACYE